MQSIRNKPDTATGAFLSGNPNRRWSVRQKIHSPAYVSVKPCEDGSIFGLNEVFDIGTDGLAFQNSEPLTPGSRVRLNLELSGIEAPIAAGGRVVWSEPSGRTGVQFRKSSLSAPRRLEEYLFLNAITACAHYEALRSGAPEKPDRTLENQISNQEIPFADQAAWPDYPAVLNYLAELSHELDTTALDLDSALELVVQRAATFLQAAGVAVALGNSKNMVCVASVGSAPEMGTRLHSGTGFSGQCVQSGALMLCDDTETDPRVDRATCQALGLRSIAAVPISVKSKVAGLIEVFSQRPCAFNKNSRIFLQRLSEMVSVHVGAAKALMAPDDPPGSIPGGQNFEGSTASLNSPDQTDSILLALDSAREAGDDFLASRWIRILILGAAATLLLVAALFRPWIGTRAASAAKTHNRYQSSLHPVTARTFGDSSTKSELDQLRELAEEGDADAQFALGARYATGDGVGQSYPTSVHWFSLAAEQGHVVAQATLGAYYWAGRGMPVNLHKAYFWSVLAQAGGDEGSRFRLESLASRLSHGEIVAVRQEADDWLRQHQLDSRAAADSQP